MSCIILCGSPTNIWALIILGVFYLVLPAMVVGGITHFLIKDTNFIDFKNRTVVGGFLYFLGLMIFSVILSILLLFILNIM